MEGNLNAAIRIIGVSREPVARRLPALALACVWLAGCAVGPDYRAPELALQPAWESPADMFDADLDPPAAWWEGFDDPHLTMLVEQALLHNFDLEVAAARVREARAARRAAGGALLPTVAANLAGERTSPSFQGGGALSELAAAGLLGRVNDDFSSGLQVAWELDLFGRLRREREAAQAQLEASAAQYLGTRLLVAAEVASTYWQWRGAQGQLDVLADNLDVQRQTREVTARKLASGLVPEIDLLRATAQLASTEAQLPALQGQVSASRFALNVLTGHDPLVDVLPAAPGPAGTPTPGEQARTLLQTPLAGRVALGQRAQLLLRRPDVMAAERLLAAATAQIGAAKAQRWPRLNLLAAGGYNAGEFSRLFESDSIQWLLNPEFTLPLFQGGQVKAGIEAAEARADQALAQYRKAVFTSLQEAHTAMTLYDREQATLISLSTAERASNEAAGIAARLYDSGLGDFLSVLDAQSRLAEVQDARIRSRTRAAMRLVDLYRALGGGAQMLPAAAQPSNVASEHGAGSVGGRAGG